MRSVLSTARVHFVAVLFVMVYSVPFASGSMWCYEGRCTDDLNQCRRCQGAGCLRVTRDGEFGTVVALTCLPYPPSPPPIGERLAARIRDWPASRDQGEDERPLMEPAGCRRLEWSGRDHGQVCICYDTDLCNRATPIVVTGSTTVVFVLAVVAVLRYLSTRSGNI